MSELFDLVDFLTVIVTVLSILYFLFMSVFKQPSQKKINGETLSNEGDSGLLSVWKKMPLTMKILFVTVDLGVLLTALYYFGAI
ncbi:MAG: hypothetical protein NLN64_05060 [Candidatus Thalassarchaeaceae archaeon]|nr:hypothetical protein [Candidatus Thalassarchaeaceae archaeon]